MDRSQNTRRDGSIPNGLPGQREGASQVLPLRIPTVREALPYTPFSSIIPFNVDLITPPLALPNTAPTAFDHFEDVKSARSELERLSAGAKRAEDASSRCQRTLKDVQRLLHGDKLTQFQFKTSKRVQPGTSSTPSKQPQLSPFANMVFANSDVQYLYLTPESETTPLKQTSSSVEPISRANPHAQLERSSPTQNVATGKELHPGPQPRYRKVEAQIPLQRLSQTSEGSTLPTSRHATNTPPQNEGPRNTPGTAYVKLGSMTPAKLAEYKKVPDSMHPGQESTPTRNQNAYLTNTTRMANVNERQKGDQAAHDLCELIESIFEAEDHMQPDTSGDVSMTGNKFFIANDKDGLPTVVLQADAQLKLDSAVQKVVACRRLDSIKVEHLVRIQRLCETALNANSSESLHIGEDWNEEDTRDWVGRLADAQTGLVAARTMMRVMTGGSQHKELQSEDYFRVALEAIRTVVERCIVPIVEERSFLGERVRGEKDIQRNPKFDVAMDNRKALQNLIQAIQKCLKLLGDLLTATDVEESGISSVEYLCKTLIFAENASTERDAALGMAIFENLRVSAMDVLGRIFTKYTEQRTFIFDEVLLSLEKLSAKKQSARQFLPKDGKPIQLVSALLMRLVQTSATSRSSALRLKVGSTDDAGDSEEADDDSDMDDTEEEEDSDDSDTIKVSPNKNAVKRKAHSRSKQPGQDLVSVYKPLLEDAQKHASYIVRLLLQRALSTSKTSDEPFRRLLDLFTEDFLSVLGNSDWPAAELLLRTLVIRMIGIAENPKSPAPSRTLSLELLGTVGCGIVDAQNNAILAARSLPQEDDDPICERLAENGKRVETGDLDVHVFTAFDGPYRVVLEYLSELDTRDSPQMQTARGYHLVQWADLVCGGRERSSDGVENLLPSNADLQSKIRNMIQDPHWLEANSDFPAPTTAQGKTAAKIVAAVSPLCKAFARIFSVVLHSMSSDQPTVRSRSIKSVTTLLEKDPSILDRNGQILNQILRSLGDNSALVRESALGLINKCVGLRPALDLQVYERVIPRTRDTNTPVRKRSMAFLKQVYLRNSDNSVRASISSALISRIKDVDEGVAEVARATIEEIWFTTFRGTKPASDRNVDALLRLRSHAALVIQTVELGENVAAVLEDLIKKLLTQSKQSADNVQICKSLVQVFFDGIIDNNDIPGAPSQSSMLRTLTVFAKAAPKMFTAGQLEHLEPYAQNLQNADDLDVYQFAVTILRYTMPVLTGIRTEFLTRLQQALLSTVGKLPKSELTVVAPCLWTIDTVLGGTEKLARVVLSALLNLNSLRTQDVNVIASKASRLLRIIGQFGKACNFDPHLDSFKAKFPWYNGKAVSGLLIEVSCSFTSPKNPTELRQAALAAVCEICSAFPEHFMRADVVNAIETVLKHKETDLEEVLLTNLEAFFNLEVTSAEEQEILGTGIESGTQRLNDTYQATSHDTASNSLAQRFLTDFLRIALSSLSEVSIAAARIIVHINTRGIAHPGESGPGLAALETCPNAAIAKMAFAAHMEQFKKHENVLEKGLVKAVQQAFEYQRIVVGDASGLLGSPPTAKLQYFWEVVRTGKPKLRSKFFTNICASMDFEIAKLRLVNDGPAYHLLYSRFCVETMSMLEFTNIDEPLQLMACLEKVTAGTGTAVAQAIESEVLQLHVPLPLSQPEGAQLNGLSPPAPVAGAVDPRRLRQLATAAQVLSLLWETRSYIRRVYNLQKYAGKPKKLKKDDKDSDRKPARAANSAALTEVYQSKINQITNIANTGDAHRKMCLSFVELSNVDLDVKIASDNEDDLELDDGDDARSEGSSARSPGMASRGKKRKSGDGGSGPPKKRSRPYKPSATRMDDDDGDDDDGWL